MPYARWFLIASHGVRHPPLPLHARSVAVTLGHVVGITQHCPSGAASMHCANIPTVWLQYAPPPHFGVPAEHFTATPSAHWPLAATETPFAAASVSFQYVR